MGLKKVLQTEEQEGEKLHGASSGKRVKNQEGVKAQNSPWVGVASLEWPQMDK